MQLALRPRSRFALACSCFPFPFQIRLERTSALSRDDDRLQTVFVVARRSEHKTWSCNLLQSETYQRQVQPVIPDFGWKQPFRTSGSSSLFPFDTKRNIMAWMAFGPESIRSKRGRESLVRRRARATPAIISMVGGKCGSQHSLHSNACSLSTGITHLIHDGQPRSGIMPLVVWPLGPMLAAPILNSLSSLPASLILLLSLARQPSTRDAPTPA